MLVATLEWKYGHAENNLIVYCQTGHYTNEKEGLLLLAAIFFSAVTSEPKTSTLRVDFEHAVVG